MEKRALENKTFGLVLGGGGARGAYEVGVLKYIYGRLPRIIGFAPRFKILCGTSVGALNACGIAAVMHSPVELMERLLQPWVRLSLDSVFEFGAKQVFNVSAWALARSKPEYSALLDPAPLRRLVRQAIPWENISRNIDRGIIRAVTVTCTDLDRGNTVTFVERAERTPYPISRDPHRTARYARLTPQHALASAAIPFIFPPVPIGNRLYNDGGVRMNVPLSPALRLGADRVMVINLRKAAAASGEPEDLGPTNIEPNLPYMLGKVIDALLLDRVEHDVHRLERINMLLRSGEKEYGEGFIDHINDTIAPLRGEPYRIVESLLLSPTEDMGHMAVQAVNRSRQFTRRPSIPATIIKKIAERGAREETDAISYLLFDAGYAEMLIDLGYADAQKRSDELAAFFTDENFQ